MEESKKTCGIKDCTHCDNHDHCPVWDTLHEITHHNLKSMFTVQGVKDMMQDIEQALAKKCKRFREKK